MVELHGWLCIRACAGDEDQLPAGEEAEAMQRALALLQASPRKNDLHYQNGTPYLQTLLDANHRGREADEIVQLYREIAAIASGSYGMIYLHDDEDVKHFNSFVVYLFRRGHCGMHIDPYFTPCIPVIEDGEVLA